MELERSTEELELERVSEHYYSSGRYYTRLSLINLNFRLEEIVKETNMSGTFTSMTSVIVVAALEKIFSEYEGKTVGEDFSISEALKHFEIDESNVKKGKKVLKEKKEKKVVKEKKPRKMNNYRLFQKNNHGEISKILAEKKKEGGDIRFITVAASMWGELSTEEKEKYAEDAIKYNEAAKNM